ALAPARHSLGEGGVAQHACAAEFHQDAAFGLVGPGAVELHGAELVGGAPVGAEGFGMRCVSHGDPAYDSAGGARRAAALAVGASESAGGDAAQRRPTAANPANSSLVSPANSSPNMSRPARDAQPHPDRTTLMETETTPVTAQPQPVFCRPAATPFTL